MLRDPVERVLSYYCYLRSYSNGYIEKHDTYGKHRLAKRLSLEDFIGHEELSGEMQNAQTRQILSDVYVQLCDHEDRQHRQWVEQLWAEMLHEWRGSTLGVRNVD